MKTARTAFNEFGNHITGSGVALHLRPYSSRPEYIEALSDFKKNNELSPIKKHYNQKNEDLIADEI